MSSGTSLATKGVLRTGITRATKGVIDEIASSGPSSGSTLAAPPLALERTRGPVMIIIPTATNFALMAVENIVTNLRAQQAANLSLPSLYKRAYLVAYETDEVAVVKP